MHYRGDCKSKRKWCVGKDVEGLQFWWLSGKVVKWCGLSGKHCGTSSRCYKENAIESSNFPPIIRCRPSNHHVYTHVHHTTIANGPRVEVTQPKCLLTGDWVDRMCSLHTTCPALKGRKLWQMLQNEWSVEDGAKEKGLHSSRGWCVWNSQSQTYRK